MVDGVELVLRTFKFCIASPRENTGSISRCIHAKVDARLYITNNGAVCLFVSHMSSKKNAPNCKQIWQQSSIDDDVCVIKLMQDCSITDNCAVQ